MEIKETLFSIVNSLLDTEDKSRIKLALISEDISLAEKFSYYFVSKLVVIRDSLSHLSSSILALTCPPDDSLMKCANKKLDPFKPASKAILVAWIPLLLYRFLIDILPEILPMLVHIVNISLSSGLFIDALKSAIVKPLLKKSTLDPDCLKNY